jgi:hypothetical protein
VDVPPLKSSGADPATWIKPVPGEALRFRIIDQELTLKPLNQSWQRFAAYWTVS